MSTEPTTPPPAICPRCREAMASSRVRTAIWIGDRLAIVEDIPAYVCGGCIEQFYDDEVSEALRRLTESGFPVAEATREMVVPVFSLDGRIVRRQPPPDGADFYID